MFVLLQIRLVNDSLKLISKPHFQQRASCVGSGGYGKQYVHYNMPGMLCEATKGFVIIVFSVYLFLFYQGLLS